MLSWRGEAPFVQKLRQASLSHKDVDKLKLVQGQASEGKLCIQHSPLGPDCQNSGSTKVAEASLSTRLRSGKL